MKGEQCLNCVKSEIHNVLSTVRLNGRWASEERFFREVPLQFETPLIRAFKTLHNYLNGFSNINEVDAVAYLKPFLDVISLPHTNGAMTGMALLSVNKFLLYGSINEESPRGREAINLTADAIIGCKFESTNLYSDEVVLMQLLEVLVNLLRCPAGPFVSDVNVWRMVETCYRLNREPGRSELLQKTAANSLTHLILTVFGRVPELVTQETLAATKDIDVLPLFDVSSTQTLHAFDGDEYDVDTEIVSLETTSPRHRAPSDVPQPVEESAKSRIHPPSEMSSSIVAHKGQPHDAAAINGTASTTAPDLDNHHRPYGVLCMIKILHVLSELTNPALHDEGSRSMALQLINIILETGGEGLGRVTELSDGTSYSPIVTVLQGDLCKFLLQNSQEEELSVLALTLRVIFNLFMAMKGHLKVQLEVFLTSVHLRIAESPSASCEQKELALESLLDFCREPALMLDLYTNYDCDVRCTNLFETLCKCLCRCTTPDSSHGEGIGGNLMSLHLIAHEAVLAVIKAIAERCDRRISRTRSMDLQEQARTNDVDSDSSVGGVSEGVPRALERAANELRERKSIKRRLMLAAKQFNLKPNGKHWQEYAQDLGVLPRPASARDVAVFLRETPGLDKTSVGEFLSEPPDTRPFCQEVLKEFAKTFKFKGIRIDEALRVFLEGFRLPGEAQKIDRIVEAFGDQLFEDNKWDEGEELQPCEDTGADAGEAPPASATLDQGGDGDDSADAPPPKDPYDPNDVDPNEECIRGVFKSPGAAFVFAFSIVMLQTDLHNNQVAAHRKMTLEGFIKNNRGINDGENFPKKLLVDVYNSIKKQQIRMLYDPHAHPDGLQLGAMSGDGASLASDTGATWDGVMRHSTMVAGASFTPSHLVRGNMLFAGVHERDMFSFIFDSVVQANSVVFEMTSDGKRIVRALEGFRDLAKIAEYFTMTEMFNRVVILLCKYFERFSSQMLDAVQSENDLAALTVVRDATVLTFQPNVSIKTLKKAVLKAELHASHPACLPLLTFRAILSLCKIYGNSMREAWSNVIRAFLNLHENNMLPASFIEIDDITDDHGHRLPTSGLKKHGNMIVSNHATADHNLDTEPVNAHTPGEAIGALPVPSTASTITRRVSATMPRRSAEVEQPKGMWGTLTSFFMPETDDLDDLRNEATMVIHDTLQALRLQSLFARSKRISEASLIHLMNSLLSVFSGGGNGRTTKIENDDVDESNTILCMELLTTVALANEERAEVVWPVLKQALNFALIRRGFREPSRSFEEVMGMENGGPDVRNLKVETGVVDSTEAMFVIERVVVNHFRLCARLLDNQKIADSLIESLEFLGILPDQTAEPLAARVGSGLSTVLHANASSITSAMSWKVINRLLQRYAHFSQSVSCVWGILTCLVEEGVVHPVNVSYLISCIAMFVYDDVRGPALPTSPVSGGGGPVTNQSPGNPRSWATERSLVAVDMLHGICDHLFTEAYKGLLRDQPSSTQVQNGGLNGQVEFVSPPQSPHDGMYVVSAETIPGNVGIAGRDECWLVIVAQFKDLVSVNSPPIQAKVHGILQQILWNPNPEINSPKFVEVFERVLFPMFEESKTKTDELRLRATSLLTGTFLHNVKTLSLLPEFHLLWLRIISHVASILKDEPKESLLYDTAIECLKNSVMVMQGEGLFEKTSERAGQNVWQLTWEVLNSNAPGVKELIETSLAISDPAVESAQQGSVGSSELAATT